MSSNPKRGVVLIAVLVIIALAAMIAATVLFRMRAELSAGSAATRGDQAGAAATSGIRAAVALLQANKDSPEIWMNQPLTFKNQLVVDDGSNKWYFSIYADASAADASGGESTDVSATGSPIRFGVTDEASKININSASDAMLGAIPNLTPDQVKNLLAYRGPAGATTQPSTTKPSAEDSGNTALADAFGPDGMDLTSTTNPSDGTSAVTQHGPLASLDELLQIPGFDATTLYGAAAPRYNLTPAAPADGSSNGSPSTVMPSPTDGSAMNGNDSASSGSTSGSGALTGMIPYVTIVSKDRDVDSTGAPRINLNTDRAGVEKLNLPTDTVRFIRIAISEGHLFNNPSELYKGQFTATRASKEYPDVRPGDLIVSGVDASGLSVIMDKLTCQAKGKDTIPGLININTAPAEVLAAVPGLTTDLAQQIVDQRANLAPDERTNIAWLVKTGICDEGSFKLAAPFLTTRGHQYTIRCIGFGWPCGRYRVYETLVDLDGDKPSYLYFRELTRLGLPIALNPDELNGSGQ
jgi:type II secretory pathway component PulK